MWQDFGSHLFQLMLLQAFVMQSAHPVIDAAVGKEKKYKYDPWGRARDSIALLWPVVYSRPQRAIDMGIRLHELHRHIKGVDKHGKRYHALDPEAYSWVHMTGFDAAVRLHEYFGRPLTQSQRQQAFREWQQMGSLLGIHPRYIPDTEAAYWTHFNQIIDERLQWGEVLDDLMDPLHYATWPVPPHLPWLPRWLWKTLATPASWLIHQLTIATLPARFRQRFGIRFRAPQRWTFNAFAWLVRSLYPWLPERLQFIPLARRARDDARRYPEAYQLTAQQSQQAA